MTKEEIIDKIVDIAEQSAFDGLSTIYAEREATVLAQKIVKNINYDTVLCPVLDFGDYGIIEMKRYGCENEQYTHKVIGRLRSNTWVDVPVQSPATEIIHDEIVDVIACVCCGVSETEVLKYRVEDVKPNGA